MEIDQTSQLNRVLLQRFGLRVQPEMGQFVLGRLGRLDEKQIPVIAGNARTGVAVRQLLAADALRAAMEQASLS